MIGRRQALCTFAGIATAVAGLTLLPVVGGGVGGIGTAHAADLSSAQGSGETVTAEEVARQVEEQAAAQRELAMVEALIPRDLDIGKWTLSKVHTPRLGAIAVIMRTPAGEPFQVDVLRRDSELSGVADTANFSLFIANSGNGSKSTDEWQARGAKVLGHHIRRTELSGAPLPTLLTFRERSNQHPSGNYGVLG